MTKNVSGRTYARLSRASAVRLKKLMKRLQNDVNALTKSEINLPRTRLGGTGYSWARKKRAEEKCSDTTDRAGVADIFLPWRLLLPSFENCKTAAARRKRSILFAMEV
jgi:hypothetical protein